MRDFFLKIVWKWVFVFFETPSHLHRPLEMGLTQTQSAIWPGGLLPFKGKRGMWGRVPNVLIFFLFPLNLLHAQYDAELPGIVVEQNSKFNTGAIIYIPNASIKSPGAAASLLSKADGSFRLQYADMPPGKVVRVYASKNDYELVNEEELKKAAVTNRLSPLKVVMCKEGQLYDNQVAYYNIAKDAAVESYKRQVAILNQDNQESRRLMAKMQVDFNREIKSKGEALTLLQEQLEKVEKRAHELADQWVTINLDDQSESYQRAFRAFMAKDVELAIAILDSVDLEKRLAINASAKKKEEALIDTLSQSIAKREQQMEQDIKQCLFKAELHELKHEYAEAEKYYKMAVKYDSTNFDNFWKLNEFLFNQNQSDSLILYARKMMQIAENDEEKASGITYLGLGLHYQTQDSLAIYAYERALKIYKDLAKESPDQYDTDVARVLNNLGISNSNLYHYSEAVSAYEKALEIYRKLTKENPDWYEGYVANTLNNMGVTYMYFEHYPEAISAYEEALDIYRKLTKENPDQYENDVAKTLNNLGIIYAYRKHYPEAISTLEEILEIYKKLARENPDRYQADLARTFNNQGNNFQQLNLYTEAISAYKQALGIRRKLAKDNPDRYEGKLANTLNNMGNVFQLLNRYPEAISAYEEALRIRRKLAGENPRVFGSGMGDSYYVIGTVKQIQFDFTSAVKYFSQADSSYALNLESPHTKTWGEDAREKIKELSRIDALGKALYKKGTDFLQEEQTDSALIYFEKAQQFYETLPFDGLDIQGHENASILYEHLSDIDSDNQKIYLYLKKAIQHKQQVYEVDQNNEDFKTNLASALYKFSKYALFAKSFEEAEKSARKTLELSPKSIGVISNLASALLFQGKYEEALDYYQKWIDKKWPDDRHATFCEVFLADLAELKAAGITHPDVAKVRAFLGNCE